MHWQTILHSPDLSLMDSDGALGPVLNFLTWFQTKGQLDWNSPSHPETSPLLSWILFVHQHPKDAAAVLAVHLCSGDKSISFLHVIMQDCTTLGSDNY